MEILSFTITGKLAHFRKYYANNTALSFSIPPRTTIMGIVASVMGWEKDSYYEKLSSDNFRFGVRVLSPLKKSFQRLNFLSIKKTGDLSKSFNSDFRGQGGRIQTPFEVISGLNLTKNEVVYQIFLQPVKNDNAAFKEIKDHFLKGSPVYNLSLGPANFQASLQHVELIQDSSIKQKESDDFIRIHSAIPVSHVEELEFKKDESNQYNFVEEDMMPGEFVGDNNREVKKMNRLLFSTTNYPLRVKLNAPYVQVETGNELLNIQFMDE
ncbi:MAG: CRISPR-associated protein Cas5 [Balneolaceae bacterium]|nr:CRISPR-associated protein Cas5 [Balneolaceae bacterium]